MKFEYDHQTFHDLGILKEYQEPSVFSIFNQTLTEGGSDYLRQIIKSPITDQDELEKRVDLIKYFADNDPGLAISTRQFKFIEKYLNLNVAVLKSNPIDALYNRLNEWFRPTNDYYLIKAGCEQVFLVLSEFNDKMRFDAVPTLLEEHTRTIRELISELKTHQTIESAEKLNWKKLISLDRLFRIRFSTHLRSFLEEVYFIDAYISIAKTSAQRNFSLPVYERSSKPKLSIKGLIHPLLENAVANDVEMDLDKNMCFLTGPNMAGKSTLLKSIGIAIFLSHLGFPVPAKELRTTVYDGIITTINLSDNLSFGYSHFYSEVNRVKEAAQALAEGKQMFVIFDELFRGTNVKDAFEASTEIIKGLAEIDTCTFFMSTHIVEIAEEIKDRTNISFKYLDSELVDNNLHYSFQLKTGVSNERLGMHIVKSAGIFDLLESIKKSDNN